MPAVGHGVLEGHRVFCTGMTFDATVNPVVYEGGIPVFIDTEADTWNMDPVALEKVFEIYHEVKVVVCVHLYGTSGKIDELNAINKKHGAIPVEDAAESLGATYKGVQTGSFGHYNTISFNGNKIITGSAGGCFLTDSKEAAEKVRKWSTQAREAASWYQHEELGYNYRMSNVIAGVVRGQFPYLEEHIAQKKAIYERYREGFKGFPVQMNPIDFANSESNYRLNPFITSEGNGHAVTNAYIAGGTLGTDGKPLDMGADIFARGLCLPSDNKMTKEQQDRVIKMSKNGLKDFNRGDDKNA